MLFWSTWRTAARGRCAFVGEAAVLRPQHQRSAATSPTIMPDPSRLLTTISRAVDAVRATPGRTGRFFELAGAEDVLIAGDLHGHIANFQALYKIADLSNHPRRHIVFQEVIHGKFRYPGGGDKSHQLLDLFCALKCQF